MNFTTTKAAVLSLFISFGAVACMEKQAVPPVTSLSPDQYKVEIIADGLKSPWSVALMPNGDYLITERNGSLKHISGSSTELIQGLPQDIFAQAQGGLFDVLLSPDFKNNGLLYISYAQGSLNKNGTTVIRAKLKNNKLSGIKELFSATPKKTGGNHFGGRLAFLGGGALALSMGEGFEFREASQDDSSDLGKVVRVTEQGSSHLSKGHRNIQGLAYDAENDTLWSHEHGPRGGDEINIITQGGNYGWPMTSHGLDYNGAKITPLKTMEGVIEPLHVWTPSIAPSGLTVYSGDMFPEWQGDLFIGGLASGDIRRLDVKNKKIIGESRILSELGERVRDIKEAPDGALLVVLEAPENGKLIRLSKP